MSGDNASAETAATADASVEVMDQEMKEDTPSIQSRRGSWTAGPGGQGDASTWNFVQMNMTLLPIARPLPVNISSRAHEALLGHKPHTPNRHLHHRILRNTSNISPRRNDEASLKRRGSMSSDSGVMPFVVPRLSITERQYSAPQGLCGKRKSGDNDVHSSGYSSPQHLYDDTARTRSHSEDLSFLAIGKPDSPHEALVSTRSTSSSVLSSLSQRGALFKDKRILELQHEERRLHPDERAALPSPSKRSRYH